MSRAPARVGARPCSEPKERKTVAKAEDGPLKTLRNRWPTWRCEDSGCWKKAVYEETEAKRERDRASKGTKPKGRDTPRLSTAVNRNRPSPRTAIEVWIRDGGYCFHCPRKLSPRTMTFDHVIPVCLGGRSHTRNLVLSCKSCNRRRGHKPLAEVDLARLEKRHHEHERDQAEVEKPREIVASLGAGDAKHGQGTGGRADSDR